MQTRVAPDAADYSPPSARPTRGGAWETVRHYLLRPEERDRLYRFCRRLTGNAEVAEDLTQEALLEAWRQADALQNPAVWRSWLHGIAKNMYLRWRRSEGREQQRRADGDADALNEWVENQPDDGAEDPCAALERAEVARLVDRAMGRLPEAAREVLTLFYARELPHAEIAARLGISESGAAVRLFRGRQILRRTLTTDLYDEAAALGLIPPVPEDGVPPTAPETHLWCPFCGRAKLRAVPFGDRTRFQCNHCAFVQGPRRADYPSDCIFGHEAFDPATVIGDVKGYKPALNRLTAFWGSYLHAARERGTTRCLGCGATLPLHAHRPAHLSPRPYAGFHIHCTRCKKIHVLLPSAFAFTTPEVQAFWRKHPRMRLVPGKGIPGRNAFVTTFESVTDCSRVEVVFRGDDYRIVEAAER
jgi:RNA polymerase sigma factor (sigma-70 family)